MLLLRQSTFRDILPRPEVIFLLAGFAITIFTKFRLGVAARLSLHDLWHIFMPDILFFGVLFLCVQLLTYCKPAGLLTRMAVVISFATLLWSVLNAIWMIESGTQLQPGILGIFIDNPVEIWPPVKNRLAHKMSFAIVVFTLTAVVSWFFLHNVIQPKPSVPNKDGCMKRLFFTGSLLILLFVFNMVFARNSKASFDLQILGFSSHYYALVSAIADLDSKKEPVQFRKIPKTGERRITYTESQACQRPNIVLIVLESIPYSATSLSDPNLDTMPTLRRLASEGVNFEVTRTPMSHTTKALWAILTSNTPVISADFREAVINDRPYESLSSILARAGYRSAFFKMAKGSFECAAGLASNLNYDWAWFRENLNDPSSYLGYLAGDDFRVIPPAFEWISSDKRPFFLTILTSATHDPYIVPNWFEKPADKTKARYLQSIRFTDRFLKQMYTELEKRSLIKDSIVCVIGDHGMSFRNQGDGRYYPFEDVIRVPWIIYWPGHLEPTRISSQRTQLDVMPTLLKLAGFDISEAGFEGCDALDKNYPGNPSFFASFCSNGPAGFINGNKKYVYLPSADSVYEYDLATDPTEENPVIVCNPENENIKALICEWEKDSQVEFDVHRFAQKLLYGHWETFASGRAAWSYYIN